MPTPTLIVLDGYTLNPGDLSWRDLEALGTVTIHDRTAPEQIIERAAHAEIVLTNKTPLVAATLAALPRLRYIGVMATGFNVVDMEAARSRNIVVTNVPAYGTASVAQMTFALLLELAQHAGHHAQSVRAGEWSRSLDWCYWDFPLLELSGLTFGIAGYGQIGRAVAKLAHAFGMKVIAFTRTPRADPNDPTHFVDLETLFRESDVLSLHCPLTPETQGMVNAARLALMKPSAFLLNTGRGPLVNEADLAGALNAGRIAGAGLDVLAVEPPDPDNPLLTARNCLITPHIAWATKAARGRLMNTVVQNVRAFLESSPQNVVS